MKYSKKSLHLQARTQSDTDCLPQLLPKVDMIYWYYKITHNQHPK